MQLANRTILITGGTSGIGLEFVKQFSRMGVSNIIITGRDNSRLEHVKRQFPTVHTLQSNVANPREIEDLYRNITRQFPDLSLIINNAGIMRNLDLQDTRLDLENITEEIETNLSGTIRMVHQFLPHLKSLPSAAIVNVSSGLAFMPFPLSPVYSASKAGIHAYTQVLRLQLKKTSVRVFELAPPSTETPLQNAFSNIDSSIAMMKVDKMVSEAIQGILKDKAEILPGMSKILKFMSRIAPKFFLSFMDKTLEKANKLK